MERRLKSQAEKPKVQEGTIEKQAALYIFRPEVKIVCSECVFAKQGRCAVFGPDETISLETGTCGLYIHGHNKKADPVPWMGYVTKEEAGYMENKTGFQCKRCEEYIPETRGCKKIDRNSKGDTPGQIHPNACCNLWEPSPITSKMTEDQLDKWLMANSK